MEQRDRYRSKQRDRDGIVRGLQQTIETDRTLNRHRWPSVLSKAAAAAAFCAVYIAMTPVCALAEGETLPQQEIQQEAGLHWQQEAGLWYLLGEDGSRQTGWQQDGGHWYYFDESGVMRTGWNEIDGKYYYFKENGAMADGSMREGETLYTFSPEGYLAYAKRGKNTGGGAFTVGFFDEKRQQLSDNLNELKEEAFDGDEEDDYYEDDKVDYDKDASFIISGRLTEIAEHRLEAARTKGYGNGKIPEEGELSEYLRTIGFHAGRRHMEVYLKNCDDADEAENKLLREHGNDEKKRSDRAVYYSEVGIAHETVNGKDYYMIIFMK